jgi:hypothetical protein
MITRVSEPNQRIVVDELSETRTTHIGPGSIEHWMQLKAGSVPA